MHYSLVCSGHEPPRTKATSSLTVPGIPLTNPLATLATSRHLTFSTELFYSLLNLAVLDGSASRVSTVGVGGGAASGGSRGGRAGSRVFKRASAFAWRTIGFGGGGRGAVNDDESQRWEGEDLFFVIGCFLFFSLFPFFVFFCVRIFLPAAFDGGKNRSALGVSLRLFSRVACLREKLVNAPPVFFNATLGYLMYCVSCGVPAHLLDTLGELVYIQDVLFAVCLVPE